MKATFATAASKLGVQGRKLARFDGSLHDHGVFFVDVRHRGRFTPASTHKFQGGDYVFSRCQKGNVEAS